MIIIIFVLFYSPENVPNIFCSAVQRRVAFGKICRLLHDLAMPVSSCFVGSVAHLRLLAGAEDCVRVATMRLFQVCPKPLGCRGRITPPARRERPRSIDSSTRYERIKHRALGLTVSLLFSMHGARYARDGVHAPGGFFRRSCAVR
jgi:hypothetical protein